MSTKLIEAVQDGVTKIPGRQVGRLKTMHLPSGAGHDARNIAKIAPMGMIFVPQHRWIGGGQGSEPSHNRRLQTAEPIQGKIALSY